MQSPAAILLTHCRPDTIVHSSNVPYAYLGVVLQLADAYWVANGSVSWTGNPVDATLALLKTCGINVDGAAIGHLQRHMNTLRERFARGTQQW